jgi:hypothetical protein
VTVEVTTAAGEVHRYPEAARFALDETGSLFVLGAGDSEIAVYTPEGVHARQVADAEGQSWPEPGRLTEQHEHH